MREQGENRQGQRRCVGVRTVTDLSQKLFEVSKESRSSREEEKTKAESQRDMPLQRVASLHSQEAR